MSLRTMCLTAALCLTAPALLLAQPPAGGPPPGGPGPGGGGARAPQKPQNLKVLPQDTDIRATMRGFTQALGTDCEFCHAVNETTHRPDFASDANPMKETARAMIRMSQDLNTKYLAQLPGRKADDTTMISCGTCHRGEKQPPAFVPAPRQPGNGPGGAAPAPGAAAPGPRPGA